MRLGLHMMLWMVSLSAGIGRGSLIEGMKRALSLYESTSYEFRMDEVRGTITVQDDMFRIQSDESEIFCDGGTLWIWDASTGDLIVMSHDPSSHDFSQNPVGLLRDLDSSLFKVGPQTSKGDVTTLTLKPLDKESFPFTSLDLEFVKGNDLPRRAFLTARNGNIHTFTIISANKTDKHNKTWFAPGQNIISEAQIVDMR